MKQDIINNLIGGINPADFVAQLIMAAFGIFFILIAGTKLRDPVSNGSPIAFSWSYLWFDNLRRIITSVSAVIATIRFAPDILGMDINMFRAFCIGMAWDGIALFVKQKTTILDPKPKP